MKVRLGHSKFAVIEGSPARRSAVCRAAAGSSNPTGGARQLQYRPAQGETGRTRERDKVVDC